MAWFKARCPESVLKSGLTQLDEQLSWVRDAEDPRNRLPGLAIASSSRLGLARRHVRRQGQAFRLSSTKKSCLRHSEPLLEPRLSAS